MTLAIHGLGNNGGIGLAVGKALKLSQGQVRAEPEHLQASQVEEEIQRFRRAVRNAARQLMDIRDEIPDDTPEDILEFIDAHLLMLEDKALSEAPEQIIREQNCSAEWALQQRRDQLVTIFDNMEDLYLRTRKDDLDHVVNRIMSLLQGSQQELPQEIEGRIVVAQDLTPADIIMLNHRGVAGFVTEFGSPMSHTAILSRSLEIPAVVGAHGAFSFLQSSETLILDARHGAVLATGDPQTLAYFQRRIDNLHARQSVRHLLRHKPARTLDGQHIKLQANIELAEDIPGVLEAGGDGIGLYRTEFLYMNRDDLPDENDHFQAYLNVVQALQGLPVTIRTLDLGADKQCEHTPKPSTCINPALGLRAIRLCLKETDIFRVQLRAILRASGHGKVRLLLPMLTNVQEARMARAIIDEEMSKLAAAGIAVDPQLPVGGMIETPAAAITAHAFAEVFDFLSIGTNDLIQYTLAVDRADDSVNFLYDPLHPAVLLLIQAIVDAGRKTGTPIAMCGEMAGDPTYIPLLLGLGLTTLSMHPSALIEAKQLIRQLHLSTIQPKVSHIMQQIQDIDLTQALKALNR